MPRFWCGLPLVLFFVSLALAQSPSTSDPQALALAAKSIAALTGGATIGDVTLTGTVTAIAGSDNQTGSVTLLAKGTSESRINLSLGNGTRSDIRNSSSGFPQGAWVDANAVSHLYAGQNCSSDPAWFFPIFSSLVTAVSNPSVVLSYVGQETLNGIAVQHLRSYVVSNQPLQQQLSTMDFYLNATSLLPMATAFNVYADSNIGTSIPSVVNFATYQAVNGVEVPFHIQRMLNGVVVLDIVVTNATFNTGLPDSLFSLQ